VSKARLPHPPDGLDPSANTHMDRRNELFGRLGALLSQNLRNGGSEFESPAVALKSQRLDLTNPGEALLQQLIFERQRGLLAEISYYNSLASRHWRRLSISLSIIIPAYNEERRLQSTLQQIFSYLRSRDWSFTEILVVDDGSTDATAAIAENFRAKEHAVRVLRNPGNRGKGYSVRQGMLEAQGEWALFTDADLSAPIEEFEKLWAAMAKHQAQVVIGSRALDRSLIGVHQSAFRENGGRLFNLVLRLVTGLPFWDTQCGFKLFQSQAAREIFRRQRFDGFGFDAEVLFIARLLGYRTVEVPVRWSHAEGTKLSLFGHTGGMLLDLFRIRWHQTFGRYR